MRKQLIAGNWKMNESLVSARALVKGLVDGLSQDGGTLPDVLICPPAHLLFPMAKAVAALKIVFLDSLWTRLSFFRRGYGSRSGI